MHKPFSCFKTYEDYASNITNPKVEELGNNGEELKDYPDEDPRDYSRDYEHDPMDCYHQIEDLLINTREILDRIEAR